MWFKYLVQLYWFVYPLLDSHNNLSNIKIYITGIGNHNILVGVKSDGACGPLLQLLPLTCLPSARPPTSMKQRKKQKHFKRISNVHKKIKNGRTFFKKRRERYNKLAFCWHFSGELCTCTTGFLLNPKTGCVWTFGQTGIHFGHNKNFFLTLFVFPLWLAAASLHLWLGRTWKSITTEYPWSSWIFQIECKCQNHLWSLKYAFCNRLTRRSINSTICCPVRHCPLCVGIALHILKCHVKGGGVNIACHMRG